jgi:hypothetical protein
MTTLHVDLAMTTTSSSHWLAITQPSSQAMPRTAKGDRIDGLHAPKPYEVLAAGIKIWVMV